VERLKRCLCPYSHQTGSVFVQALIPFADARSTRPRNSPPSLHTRFWILAAGGILDGCVVRGAEVGLSVRSFRVLHTKCPALAKWRVSLRRLRDTR
jgi:hypothetical protein